MNFQFTFDNPNQSAASQKKLMNDDSESQQKWISCCLSLKKEMRIACIRKFSRFIGNFISHGKLVKSEGFQRRCVKTFVLIFFEHWSRRDFLRVVFMAGFDVKQDRYERKLSRYGRQKTKSSVWASIIDIYLYIYRCNSRPCSPSENLAHLGSSSFLSFATILALWFRLQQPKYSLCYARNCCGT